MVAAELVVSVSYTLQKFIQLPIVALVGVSAVVADPKTTHTNVVSSSSCSNSVSCFH